MDRPKADAYGHPFQRLSRRGGSAAWISDFNCLASARLRIFSSKYAMSASVEHSAGLELMALADLCWPF